MEKESILSMLENNEDELYYKAKEKKEKHYAHNITFSRNLFVPVTHQCRNRCGYCGFVSDDINSWIIPDSYQILLEKAKQANCKEILLTLGEKPEEKYQSARALLSKYGFESTVSYVNNFCKIAVEKDLLPHSNLGVISYEDLKILKENNASMGLMLETSSKRLMEPGQPHSQSPGKDPIKRLETIINAGKLMIPFTTGILIGIGESWQERIDSLIEINNIHSKYSHIQEVIVQNFNPQPGTPMADNSPPTHEEILLSLAVARLILNSSISLQIPPNLNKEIIIEALEYGANDVGGISPLTIDYINPNKSWHTESELRKQLYDSGYELLERLPVYPQYEKYLNSRIRQIIKEYHKNEKTLYSNN